MNTREKLVLDMIQDTTDTTTETLVEWAVPEDNSFDLKHKPRLDRMLKSEKARDHRHMLREVKQNKYDRGFTGNCE